MALFTGFRNKVECCICFLRNNKKTFTLLLIIYFLSFIVATVFYYAMPSASLHIKIYSNGISVYYHSFPQVVFSVIASGVMLIVVLSLLSFNGVLNCFKSLLCVVTGVWVGLTASAIIAFASFWGILYVVLTVIPLSALFLLQIGCSFISTLDSLRGCKYNTLQDVWMMHNRYLIITAVQTVYCVISIFVIFRPICALF